MTKSESKKTCPSLISGVCIPMSVLSNKKKEVPMVTVVYQITVRLVLMVTVILVLMVTFILVLMFSVKLVRIVKVI